MKISVEISYYPLIKEFEKPIEEFIAHIKKGNGITLEIGAMSTVISGEYGTVMALLTDSMKSHMMQYPSVFTLKVANACKVCGC